MNHSTCIIKKIFHYICVFFLFSLSVLIDRNLYIKKKLNKSFVLF